MDRANGQNPPEIKHYSPVAVYYQDADSLEYVRRDEPSVHRRIDDLLTLVLSMDTRQLLGFQLKGFRHFYINHVKGKLHQKDDEFPMLILVLEEAVRLIGHDIFDQDERRSAYLKARDIAEEDSVKLLQFSEVA